MIEAKNAFIGKTEQPTPEEVCEALGVAAPVWQDYLDWLSARHNIHDQEWKSVSAKYGWALRMKLKKRTIVYLSPSNDCIIVSFVLGDRAMAAAKSSNPSKSLLKVLDAAPKYAEGTGVRLVVKKASELASVKLLTQIKLDN